MSEQPTKAAARMSETQSIVAEYWQHRKPKYRNRRPVDVALARAVLLKKPRKADRKEAA